MAYANFIPSVWNEGINRELERLCVFVEDCNRQYEGSVKKKGESVTILGVGKPTIKSLAKANRNNDIDAPEEIEDTSVIMYINQIRYFNYMVGDIDKAQAVNGVMDALEQETSEGLADEVDKYVASFAVDSSVAKLNASPGDRYEGQYPFYARPRNPKAVRERREGDYENRRYDFAALLYAVQTGVHRQGHRQQRNAQKRQGGEVRQCNRQDVEQRP